MNRVTFSKLSIMLASLCALTAAAAQDKKPATAQPQSAETRDWSAIDTNKDHHISPEEMEKYLKEVWARQSKKS